MLAVEAVRKRYGPIVAVDDLSFEVDRGEVVGFLGPNGAGKTTTMRMLTGTVQPDSGVVRFDGAPIEADLEAAKRRVGFLPESNPLYEDLLVSEYLEYVAELRGMGRAETRAGVADAVSETGIAEVFHRPIGQLSKGYRQRVGLAAAILHRPEVLILDEPTEGLDPNQRVDIRRLVNELGRDRTVLLSTHVMQEVEATCSRVLILNRGRLVAQGGVRDLIARRSGAARYVVEVAGDDAAAVLAALPGVTSHRSEPVEGRTRVLLDVAGGQELRPTISGLAAERSWTLWELHREQASLEQVFRSLTGDGSGLLEERREALAASSLSSEADAEADR